MIIFMFLALTGDCLVKERLELLNSELSSLIEFLLLDIKNS